MKVEFMKGPSHYVDVSAPGTRVLTENLMRDDRLDTVFNMATIVNEIKSRIYLKKEFEPKIDKLRKDLSKVYNICMKSAAAVYSSYKYADSIPDSVKHDTILYSANNGVFDFPPIISMLNAGLRVVVGGPTAALYKDRLRKTLTDYGCKNLHNLIIVSGFVDLTTDIHKIVSDWKDTTIVENDFSTFWDCEKDFVQPLIPIIHKIRNSKEFSIATLFENGCWWKKCTFCNYRYLPIASFIDNVSVEKVVQNILNTCKLHNTKRVFIGNDYFVFKPFSEEVFKVLKEQGIRIEIYTGIQLLKNIQYVKKIEKYISRIYVGVESLDDFSLKYINKGFTSQDVLKAFDNIMNICDPKLEVHLFLMIDLPIQNRFNVVTNYEKIYNLKQKLLNNNFQVGMLPKLLEVNRDLLGNDFIDNKFLRVANHDSQFLSGRYIIWKMFEDLGIAERSIYRDRTTPLERYGTDGSVIPSDLFLISDKLFGALSDEN